MEEELYLKRRPKVKKLLLSLSPVDAISKEHVDLNSVSVSELDTCNVVRNTKSNAFNAKMLVDLNNTYFENHPKFPM